MTNSKANFPSSHLSYETKPLPGNMVRLSAISCLEQTSADKVIESIKNIKTDIAEKEREFCPKDENKGKGMTNFKKYSHETSYLPGNMVKLSVAYSTQNKELSKDSFKTPIEINFKDNTGEIAKNEKYVKTGAKNFPMLNSQKRKTKLSNCDQWTCDKCEFYTYKNQDELLMHKVKKHDYSKDILLEYTCNVCSKTYQSQQFLKNHKRHVHEEHLFQCKGCNYNSSYKSSLKRHIKREHLGISQTCEKCDYKSYYGSDLKLHIKTKHLGITFDCIQCDYKVLTKCGLKYHIGRKHEGKPSKKFSCDLCYSKFSKVESLQLHLNQYHEGNLFSCNSCDFKATERKFLKFHADIKHPGYFFPCEQCNFKTTEKRKYHSHSKIKHEGIYFSCEDCDFSSPNMKVLANHVRTKHST